MSDEERERDGETGEEAPSPGGEPDQAETTPGPEAGGPEPGTSGPAADPAPGGADAEPGGGDPAEEELRRRMEEEIRNLRIEDVLVQSAASLVNLTARRIAKEDERDLEQARTGIEAVRALVELLPEQPQRQIRGALSELQLLFAKAAEPGASEAEPSKPEAERPAGGGPPPGLWTPPGSG